MGVDSARPGAGRAASQTHPDGNVSGGESLRGPLFWSVTGSATAQLLQIGIGILLARLLGPGAFGLLGLALVVTGAAGVMTEAGLGPVVIQRRTLSPQLLATIFWTGVAGGFLQFALIWITAPWIAQSLGEEGLVPVLRGCGISLLLGPLALVQRSLLARALQFRALARLEVAAAVVGSTAAAGLAVAGAGVQALVARVVIGATVSAAMGWLAHPWRPPLPYIRGSGWSWAEFRRLLPFGGGLAGSELLSMLGQNSDSLLIGRCLGAEALGSYSLAYNLATLPQGRLAPALGRVLFPAFSRLQDDPVALRDGYLRLLRRISQVAFPVLIAMGVAGPVLLPAVYGPQWHDAACLLPPLCVAGAFYAVATTVGTIYRSKGRADRELWTTLVRAALLAACVGISLFGWRSVNAVAIATAAYAAVSTIVFQLPANGLIGLRMREYLHALVPGAATAALVGAALCLFLSLGPGWSPAALLGVTSALLICGVSLSLRLSRRDPRREVVAGEPTASLPREAIDAT